MWDMFHLCVLQSVIDRIMIKTCIAWCVICVMSITWADDFGIPYQDSFAANYFSQKRFERTLKGFQASKSKDQDIAYNREFGAAVPFLEHIRGHKEPQLERFINEDISSNPMAVLWAQYFQIKEGRRTRITNPDQFRHLGLFLSLGFYLKDDEDRALVAKLFLEALSRLDKESFLQSYYDASHECAYDQLWTISIPTSMLWLSDNDVESIYNFVHGYVFLKHDIGAWCWDRDFAKRIVTEYASSVFIKDNQLNKDTMDYPINYRGDIEYEVMTRMMTYAILGAKVPNPKWAAYQSDLYADLIYKVAEETRLLFNAIKIYGEKEGSDKEWTTYHLSEMMFTILGLSPSSIPKIIDAEGLESIERLNSDDASRLHERERSVVDANDKDMVMPDIRRALLTKEGCLNTDSLKVMSQNNADMEFWRQWRSVVEARLAMYDHYCRAIIVLPKPRRTQRWEFVRFWPQMHQMRNYVDSLGDE